MLETANILEAQEQIVRFDAQSYGQADQKGRSKIFKRYHRQAQPEKHVEKSLSLESLKSIQKTINQNKAVLK